MIGHGGRGAGLGCQNGAPVWVRLRVTGWVLFGVVPGGHWRGGEWDGAWGKDKELLLSDGRALNCVPLRRSVHGKA